MRSSAASDVYKRQVSGSFAHSLDRSIVTLATLCAVFTFLCSAVFHLFCCIDERTHRRLLVLDLFGVLAIILSFYFTGLYFGFYFHPRICFSYMAAVAFFSLLAIAATVVPSLRENRPLRALIFALLAGSGFIPMVHWIVIRPSEEVAFILPQFLQMYLFLGLGFFFFMTHIPERYFPASRNVCIYCNSHTIWHLLVTLATMKMHFVSLEYTAYIQKQILNDSFIIIK